MTDTWRQDHLHQLARRMVELEQWANEREAAGDDQAAAHLRQRRELVQWQRSAFLREHWSQSRVTATIP